LRTRDSSANTVRCIGIGWLASASASLALALACVSVSGSAGNVCRMCARRASILTLTDRREDSTSFIPASSEYGSSPSFAPSPSSSSSLAEGALGRLEGDEGSLLARSCRGTTETRRLGCSEPACACACACACAPGGLLRFEPAEAVRPPNGSGEPARLPVLPGGGSGERGGACRFP
jgi:hypothetical protein